MIASVEEPAVEVIDGEMKKLEGEVTRRPLAEVMGELEAAEDAADAVFGLLLPRWRALTAGGPTEGRPGRR